MCLHKNTCCAAVYLFVEREWEGSRGLPCHWTMPWKCDEGRPHLRALQDLHEPKVRSRSLLFQDSVCSLRTSTSPAAPTHGTRRCDCCSAKLRGVSTDTIPNAKLHAKSPSTSPCSAPLSLGLGSTPSCSTWEIWRCIQTATVPCIGTRWLAELLTAPRSIIPKQFINFDSSWWTRDRTRQPIVHAVIEVCLERRLLVDLMRVRMSRSGLVVLVSNNHLLFHEGGTDFLRPNLSMMYKSACEFVLSISKHHFNSIAQRLARQCLPTTLTTYTLAVSTQCSATVLQRSSRKIKPRR